MCAGSAEKMISRKLRRHESHVALQQKRYPTMNISPDTSRVIVLAAWQRPEGSKVMNVGDILALKGSDLKMIKPTETVGNLARQLQQARIGAMVVSQDGQTIDGIISERDIAYSLAERRGELHLLPVSALMTRKVTTCSPEDSLSQVAALMSRHKIRHLPVEQNGRLVGIVSIRDVLEHRVGEIERKASLVMELVSTSD